MLTDYVATRWYRAPEILLGCSKYTKGVDIWATGCILGEMSNRRAVFPGTSTLNQVRWPLGSRISKTLPCQRAERVPCCPSNAQLEKIMEMTGVPNAEDIASVRSPHASTLIESIVLTTHRTLPEMFPNMSPDARDLLASMFHFNANKRCTADDALRHPYIADFYLPEDDVVGTPEPLRLGISDNTKLSAAEYRDRLYQEIANRCSCWRSRGAVFCPCRRKLTPSCWFVVYALSVGGGTLASKSSLGRANLSPPLYRSRPNPLPLLHKTSSFPLGTIR